MWHLRRRRDRQPIFRLGPHRRAPTPPETLNGNPEARKMQMWPQRHRRNRRRPQMWHLRHRRDRQPIFRLAPHRHAPTPPETLNGNPPLTLSGKMRF